jgi:hypothetical protein
MDRGQVIVLHKTTSAFPGFHLAGIYASFPSDLDTEIKRYELHIKCFRVGDNRLL